jgi:hypothetical protein
VLVNSTNVRGLKEVPVNFFAQRQLRILGLCTLTKPKLF